MIRINGKEISAIFVGQKVVSAVYVGAKIVWSAVRSCFGSGYWRSDRPWKGTDGWRRK